MRSHWLALAGLLLGAGLQAQQPPQSTPPQQSPPPTGQAAAAPAPGRLDELLQRWEKAMQGIQTLAAEIARTEVDKTYQVDKVYLGTAKYMKPNLAVLQMQKKGNPEIWEKYLYSGTFLYQWVPTSKVINVHELPQVRPGQVSDDNLLSFLLGMKAEEARKRYDLRLTKEDQWYVYVEVLPKAQADKAEFQKARLVLNLSNFLPRQFWFEQANGNEVTWDFNKIEGNVRVERSEFAPPTNAPAGWNLVRAPRAEAAQPPPSVVRPKQEP